MVAGQNAQGQFTRGNKLSVGNKGGRPKRRKGYLDILESTCTPAKWRKICERAVADAMKGDKVARRWVSENLVGKPVYRIKEEVDNQNEINEDIQRGIDKVYADGEGGGLPEGSD